MGLGTPAAWQAVAQALRKSPTGSPSRWNTSAATRTLPSWIEVRCVLTAVVATASGGAQLSVGEQSARVLANIRALG
jgi:hypothetical protein